MSKIEENKTENFEDYLIFPIATNEDGSYNEKSLRDYENAITIQEELQIFKNDNKLYLERSEIHKGTARKTHLKAYKYNGKYGVGYIVDIPDFTPDAKRFERRFYLFKSPEERAALKFLEEEMRLERLSDNSI